MGKKLIITEKPSVARQFASALRVSGTHNGYIENDEWIITWCVGHLVTLSYPQKYDPELENWSLDTLPFLPKTYKYEVIKQVKDQFAVVKELLNRSDVDVIYNAGDSGREGEYIQRLVYTKAGVEGKKKILRVWIDSQTDDEIKRGIREAKPESAYDNLSAAAYERAIADYAVGINLSRAMSCKFGYSFNKKIGSSKYIPLSVGRVMTCVLGMVVDREREIRNFVPTKYYKIDAKHDGWASHWKPVEGTKYFDSDLLYNENGFKEEKDANALRSDLMSDPYLAVKKADTKNEKKKAPLLYNLAELQSECSKKFKISPSKTLEIAQTLYEAKLTTYPRTDARVISTPVAKEIEDNIEGVGRILGWKEPDEIIRNGWYKGIDKTRYTDDSKITDHYAIIPTGQGGSELKSLDETERKVYELICRRFLAIFYPAAEYNKTDIELVHSNGEHFFASEKYLTAPGYLTVYGSDDDEEDGANGAKLGGIHVGDKVSSDFVVANAETTPPKHYTSGSIILAMENAGKLIEDEELRAQIKGSGIGTSATRAETISKLVKQTYISLNNKTQIIGVTATGEALYDIIQENIPSLLSPKMTASWEKGLAQIEEGTVSAEAYRSKLEGFVRDSVSTIKSKESAERPHIEKKEYGKCPVCGDTVYETEKGFFCGKKTCKFSFQKEFCGHSLSKADIDHLMAGEETGLMDDLVSKSGKTFAAMLKPTKDGVQLVFPTEASDIICPKCGKPLRKGSYSYECDCGFTFPIQMASHEFDQLEMNLLVRNGEMDIKGFKSKTGKDFDAKVKYVARTGKLEFDFGDSSKKSSGKSSFRKKK